MPAIYSVMGHPTELRKHSTWTYFCALEKNLLLCLHVLQTVTATPVPSSNLTYLKVFNRRNSKILSYLQSLTA